MWLPSLSTVLSVAFLAYMGNSMWTIAQLYFPPTCEKGQTCLKSDLENVKSGLKFLLLTSNKPRPSVDKDLNYVSCVDLNDPFDDQGHDFHIDLTLNEAVTKKNASFYLTIFSLPLLESMTKEKPEKSWKKWIKSPQVNYAMVTLTQSHIPEAQTFSLLNDDDDDDKEDKGRKKEQPNKRLPQNHIRSKVKLNIMTDLLQLPRNDVPLELTNLVRFADQQTYLPLLFVDELSFRLKDLVLINDTDKRTEMVLEYRPISIGKLRLFVQFGQALHSLKSLGFTDKDVDEVKGIFVDTNFALLLITFGVSAVHLLFDFLAFKNDIYFWKGKRNMEGLSSRTLLWRAFSQSVIFLYLMDEETSLLVLVPSGIAALIEMWKVTKMFTFSLRRDPKWLFVPCVQHKLTTKAEQDTEAYDSESMKYLSYVMYPLIVGGAGYSLLYTPHKSWWSWTISSLVNGVYAFGFLFMLPQLFVNYKLKSVAHLPWRAFMYKAFNTFIDDLFAFIITMPTAHRVACFRDDVVFIIYLYQRYLYPVDKSRIDTSTGMIEDPGNTADGQKAKKE